MSREFTSEEMLGVGWPAGVARESLIKLAAQMAADVKHIRANLDAARTQEEFELFLEHGLGCEEDEVAESVKRVLEKAAEGTKGGKGGEDGEA